MSDLTDSQRIERARRAQAAIDEFFDPAFEVVAEEYHNRLAAICATEPWSTNKIAALANAGRVAGEVRSQIMALIADGEHAKSKKTRAEKIEGLSPARRRLFSIAPQN
jgi:hypothetical protein